MKSCKNCWIRTGRYLEAEPEAGVGQQMDAALHDVFSDAEVGGKLCFHIRTVKIFNILTLIGGRRDFCKDHMVC